MPDNNSVARFSYIGQDIRVVTIAGKPWWVAADVTRALGLANGRDAVSRLDQDGVGFADVIDSMGRSQSARVINEPALYELIFQSRVPRASGFKTWVYTVVLPEINRTGAFGASPVLDPSSIEGAALIIQAANVALARVQELEPIAAHADVFRAAEGLRTIGDVANDFKQHCAQRFPGVKVRHQDVWDHAGRLGLVIRGKTVRHNQPTALAAESGWAKPHRTVFETDTRGDQTSVSTRLTPKGEARLWDGMCAWLGQHGDLRIAEVAA